MKTNRNYTLLMILITSIFLGFAYGTAKEKEEKSSEMKIEEEIRSSDTLNTLSEKEKQEGWKLLFDGKTTYGWRGFQKETVGDGWEIREGTLVALGKGGDLGGDIITIDQFENFELKLEWKISEEGNSGILYNVIEEDYKTVYSTGPEYQLIDDIGYPEELQDWQKTGANYAMHPPVNAKIKNAGEWNTSRILVKDGHVEHWLSGTKVVEYQLWAEEWEELVKNSIWKDYPGYGLAKKGHISLQDHGSLAWFRNIKIRGL